MPITITEQAVHTLEFKREEEIAAPMSLVFESILDEMGPRNLGAGDQPMPMKIEAWPGGRWFRDLGNNAGHWWGTIQAIKPPTLLEICGPLMMSYPAVSNVQYRLVEQNGATLLKFTHRAIGYLSHDPALPQHWNEFEAGWDSWLARIRAACAKNAKKK